VNGAPTNDRGAELGGEREEDEDGDGDDWRRRKRKSKRRICAGG
jgi:hypothetical protein